MELPERKEASAAGPPVAGLREQALAIAQRLVNGKALEVFVTLCQLNGALTGSLVTNSIDLCQAAGLRAESTLRNCLARLAAAGLVRKDPPQAGRRGGLVLSVLPAPRMADLGSAAGGQQLFDFAQELEDLDEAGQPACGGLPGQAKPTIGGLGRFAIIPSARPGRHLQSAAAGQNTIRPSPPQADPGGASGSAAGGTTRPLAPKLAPKVAPNLAQPPRARRTSLIAQAPDMNIRTVKQFHVQEAGAGARSACGGRPRGVYAIGESLREAIEKRVPSQAEIEARQASIDGYVARIRTVVRDPGLYQWVVEQVAEAVVDGDIPAKELAYILGEIGRHRREGTFTSGPGQYFVIAMRNVFVRCGLPWPRPASRRARKLRLRQGS